MILAASNSCELAVSWRFAVQLVLCLYLLEPVSTNGCVTTVYWVLIANCEKKQTSCTQILFKVLVSANTYCVLNINNLLPPGSLVAIADPFS